MRKNFKEKLAKFVEEERKSGLDNELLTRLHEILTRDTLYWDMPVERRNTFNAFFRDLHGKLEEELLTGKYGASILIDHLIVTTFEAGYHLGQDEQKQIQDELLNEAANIIKKDAARDN